MEGQIHVLWISRHSMTEFQIADLERICGRNAAIIQYDATVKNVGELSGEIRKADVIAAVLPPMLLSQLVQEAGGKPVLQSVSGRIPTGRKVEVPGGGTESEYEFRHIYWQQILEMKMTVRNFNDESERLVT